MNPAADFRQHHQSDELAFRCQACHECSTASVAMRSVNGSGYTRPLQP
jgi:hypothetical protein